MQPKLALAVLAAAAIALAASAVAGASKGSTRTQAMSNSIAALHGSPYSLVGLDRTNGAKAVPALRARAGSRSRIASGSGACRARGRSASSRRCAGRACCGRSRARPRADRGREPVQGRGRDAQVRMVARQGRRRPCAGAARAGQAGYGDRHGRQAGRLDLLDRKGKKIWDVTPLNWQETTKLDEWHGTQVSEVIGAPGNDMGVVGVYPRAKLYEYDATLVGCADDERADRRPRPRRAAGARDREPQRRRRAAGAAGGGRHPRRVRPRPDRRSRRPATPGKRAARTSSRRTTPTS